MPDVQRGSGKENEAGNVCSPGKELTMGLIQADARNIPLKNESVQCVVTSPPYWGLRDYQADGQIGLEATPEEYVSTMVDVFREVWRVLKGDGIVWLNLGDCYATGAGQGFVPGGGGQGNRWKRNTGHWQPNRLKIPGLKPKDLVGIPWRVGFALQADGWYLRSDIIWNKPNPMPESVTDRPTKSHEYLFLLTKRSRYYYDAEAIKEPSVWGEPNSPRSIKSPHGQGFTRRAKQDQNGKRQYTGFDDRYFTKGHLEKRNKRSVWTVSTAPFSGAHFATFPPKLIQPCILAGSKPGDIVLDPFCGSGTTMRVAESFNRIGIGCDLTYQDIARKRISNIQRELRGFNG